MDSNKPTGEKTLLEWAQALCPDSPRKRLKEWISNGRFYLDGEVVTRANQPMPDPGERLTLGAPDSATASWVNRRKIHPKVSVLYLDSALAIVDKGAGLLSVPMEGYKAKSALEVLGDYLNDPKGDALRRRLFGSPEKVRPLPVHRLDQYTSGLLDQYTSGLLCIALNEDSRHILIDQLRRHELLREYLAFTDGTCHEESGTWRHHLRLSRDNYKQSIHSKPVPGSTEAVTHFTLDKVFPMNRVSKLKIRLETGLKHQIRIQAAEAGLPLIGDRVYHKGTVTALKRKGATLPYGFKRQALHASVIGLKHPEDGRDLRFESNMPLDMVRLEERLR
jgi:23S rRNA pseudouridine1911/1915/1917 synthase